MESNYTLLSFPALSTFLFVVLAIKLWRKFNSGYGNLPPGPSKLPLIGSMHHLFGSSLLHRLLSDMAKKYGPVMQLRLGEVTNIIISSPEAAKVVMKTHDIVFAQRPFMLSAKIIFYDNSDLASAPYGDYWRQLRKICTLELLTVKRVESFRPIREEELSKLISGLNHSAGTPINLTSKFQTLSYSIISRAAFGKVWSGKDVFLSLMKSFSDAFAGFSLADLYPSVKLFQQISGVKKIAETIHHELDQILEDIIKEHIRKNSATKTGVNNEEEDLVDVLLNLQSKGGLQFPLTNNNIKAVILDMFIGGTESSATVLEWTMSELLRNPKLMKKAQEEVRRAFGKTGKVEETKLGDLSYLQCILKETLRLYPPFPLVLPRESSEKCEINGYDIPAKSKILVNAWAIGRDPNYWVEAEKFNPDRFIDSSVDFKGTHFEFIPFGAGRRICPGISFGMNTVEYALSHLLYHFDWKLAGEIEPQNLDMTEVFGIAMKRKSDLMVIPIPHVPQ